MWKPKLNPEQLWLGVARLSEELYRSEDEG